MINFRLDALGPGESIIRAIGDTFSSANLAILLVAFVVVPLTAGAIIFLAVRASRIKKEKAARENGDDQNK